MFTFSTKAAYGVYITTNFSDNRYDIGAIGQGHKYYNLDVVRLVTRNSINYRVVIFCTWIAYGM